MVSERTFTDAWHALGFLFLYGLVATAIAPRFMPYPRVLAALAVAIVIFGALDILPPLVKGERPLIDSESRLYSVRGLVMLISIVLVTAVTIDWLRATTAFSEVVVTVAGFTVGIAIVVGPLVAYYWRRSRADRGPA
jgi:hypothetical protein